MKHTGFHIKSLTNNIFLRQPRNHLSIDPYFKRRRKNQISSISLHVPLPFHSLRYYSFIYPINLRFVSYISISNSVQSRPFSNHSQEFSLGISIIFLFFFAIVPFTSSYIKRHGALERLRLQI